MKYAVIFLALIVVFSACKENQNLHEDLYELRPPSDSNFKKEIPANYYNYIGDKYKEKQLALEYIESGYENFQIRLWIDYALHKGRELYIIKNKNGTWSAQVYKMMTEQSIENRDSIVSKEIKSLDPKSGWDYLLTNLTDLKFTTLPDMANIPTLIDMIDDGVYFNIEIANKYQYRYYSYHSPEQFQDIFWEARNMVQIVNLIRGELNPN
jgi:hypothetical protein